ncbi:MAG: sulfotransferase [Geodermatophilaceae bacterium]
MSTLRSLARGSALNLGAAVVATVANIALVLLVARGFPVQEAGIFFVATTVFLLVARLAELGTGTGLVYFLSRYRALGLPGKLVRSLQIAMTTVVGVSVALGIALFACAPWLDTLIGGSQPGTLTRYLRILAVFLPLAAVCDTALAATRGHGTMRPSALIDKVARPAAQAVLAMVAVAVGSGVALILAWVTPYLVAAALACLWLLRLLDRATVKAAPADRVAGEFWRFTGPRAVASVSQIALQRLDIVLIAVLRGPAEAAIYTATTRFLIVGQLAGQAISQAVQPKLAALLAHADTAGTKRLYQTATCWLILLVWPFYLGFALLAPWVLQLFGTRYVDGVTVVAVLAAAMLFATGCGMVDTVLNMAGRTTWSLGNALLALAVCIGVDLLLIPPLGIMGAAIGWAAAIVVNSALPLAQIWLSLGLHPLGRGTRTAIALCTVCFGLLPLSVILLAGYRALPTAAALTAGFALFLIGCWRWRTDLDLEAMRSPRAPKRAGRVDHFASAGRAPLTALDRRSGSVSDPDFPVPPPAHLRRFLMLGVIGLLADHRERGRLTGRQDARRSISSLNPALIRPVFIVGAPRSGTTFLGSRIGAVTDFSYHFEPRLTKAAAAMVYEGAWSAATAARVFRTSYRALLLAGLHGGLRFAEKNPENCFILPFLHSTFPDASFIHIVRDGRDVAVSLSEKPWLSAASAGSGLRGRGDQPWGPYPRFWVEPDRREEFMSVSDLERTGWCWRRFTEAGLSGAAELPADRVLLVRYERMVTQPEAVAESVADFLALGVPSRQMLHGAMTAADPSSVGRWRHALPAAGLDDVLKQALPLLTRLGYADE